MEKLIKGQIVKVVRVPTSLLCAPANDVRKINCKALVGHWGRIVSPSDTGVFSELQVFGSQKVFGSQNILVMVSAEMCERMKIQKGHLYGEPCWFLMIGNMRTMSKSFKDVVSDISIIAGIKGPDILRL